MIEMMAEVVQSCSEAAKLLFQKNVDSVNLTRRL